MKVPYYLFLVLLFVISFGDTYGSEKVVNSPSREKIYSAIRKGQEAAREIATTNRATTYSSLLTLNVSNTIVVALLAAAGAFYYGGVPFFSIRRSITGLWDRWDSGFSDMWQSGLSGLGDAIQALTPVVQEAIRVYNERNSL